MSPVKLSLKEKLALRAVFVVGALAMIAWGFRVDTTELVAKGGASEDALKRRRYIVRRLREDFVQPKDIATTFDLFKGEYAFGTYAMSAYALVNIAHDAPETTAETLEVLDLIIGRFQSPEIASFDTMQWGARVALENLEPGSGDVGHIAYLGHLNLVIGARKLLGGDGRHDALHARITKAIERRMRSRPHRHVETYPGEVYTMDNVVAVASLAIADRVNGTRTAVIGEWLDYTKRRLLDPASGLIVFGVEDRTGEPLQRGRGSAAGWASFFLPLIDRDFARDQFARARTTLSGKLGPFAGFREYQRDDPSAGWGDIDSGPVLVWGVSATGFSLAGARHAGDGELLSGLLSLAEAFGITRDHGDERRYIASPLLGDAILLCMKTARPWKERP